MRRIFIIDDRGKNVHPQYPKYQEFSDFLRFLEVYPAIHEEDATQVATIFVHRRNEYELNWCEDSLSQYFVITGGSDRPSKDDQGKVFYVPRPIFDTYIIAFLEHYKRTSSIAPEIFWGSPPGSFSASTDSSNEPVDKPGVIQFTTENTHTKGSIFLVHRLSDGSIDYFKTLEPLRTHIDGRLILLRQTYYGPWDGLWLAYRIRLAAFLGDFSRLPIFLKLSSSITEVMHYDYTLGCLLFSNGFSTTEPEFPNQEWPKPLSHQELLSILERIAMGVSSRPGMHDLLSEWGAISFLMGYNSLFGAALTNIFTLSLSYVQKFPALAREQSWQLLSWATLKRTLQQIDKPLSSEESLKLAQIASNWRDFVSQNTIKPLKILFIDDHVDRGWDLSMKVLESAPSNLGDVSISAYPKHLTYRFDEIIGLLRNDRWDLVICDLRLEDGDRAKETSADLRSEELTGAKLIARIKRHFPHLPVIALTASEKSWNQRYVIDIGADEYLIKDNPIYNIGFQNSTTMVSGFLQSVIRLISRKRRTDFLWETWQRLEAQKNKTVELARFRFSSSAYSTKIRYDTIAEKLKRAYGYLDYEPTTFRREVFSQIPEGIAFLYIWSCINEIFHLYFQEELSSGNYSFLSRQNGWMPFANVQIKTNGSNKLTHEPSIELLAASNLLLGRGRSIILSRTKLWDGDYSPDVNNILILLRENNRPDLEASFERCRNLRNNLELEHGHTIPPVMPSDNDIRDICAIILFLLT